MSETIKTISHIRIGNVEHPIDAVTVGGRTLPDASELLPSISSEDEGKILMVLQGQWETFTPSDLYDEINGIDCGSIDYEKSYLTLDILTTGTVKWNAFGTGAEKTIQYSINGGEWTSITSSSAGETINVSAGDQVRLKGENTVYAAASNQNLSGFGGKDAQASTGTSTFNVYGNILSLIYGDNFINQTSLTSSYNFCSLFDGSNVISAENLILPSMTLTQHCYRALFANCPYLTTAPALPATTLAASCYRFMFSSCSSLTTAPVLEAETLVTECYYGMFMGCSSLHYIKCLATSISASNCTKQWVQNVASTGTFVKAKDMSSWTINNVNGIPNGWTVEDDGYIDVSDPIISFENNTITISCETTDSVIYYRLGTTGSFQVYSQPIEISTDTHVEAYASVSGTNSNTVSYDCTYVPDEGDSDYGDSDYGDSDSDVPVDHDYSQDYLTFHITDGGSIATAVGENTSYQYRKNGGEWTSVTSTISVSTGDVVEFKGTPQQYNHINFESSLCGFTVSGNVMSIYDPTNFTVNTTLLYANCFDSLFKGCIGLTSAENLILPATTLATSCYESMFYGCTSLTSAPVLSATTMESRCYNSMFEGCSSLTTPPVLPATTLATGCYQEMFVGCTSLTSTPVLPATTLDIQSYYKMFKGCTSLTSVSTLSATTLANNCYRSMFEGCTSLTSAPVLPATTLVNSCYYEMFKGCTSLVTAPELPAQTLVSSCYQGMFYGCSSLNYIKCLAIYITSSTNYCTVNWTNGVAATGTFVKDAAMTWWPLNSSNGIPTGWTVEAAAVDYGSDADQEVYNYLTFTAVEDSTFSFTGNTLQYSVDDGTTWATLTSDSSTPTISTGNKILWKQTGLTPTSNSGIGSFSSTGNFNVSGNIMSLLYGDDFIDYINLAGKSYAFKQLFSSCTKLINAENLILPATVLSNSCYQNMFYGCSNLTTIPELPATTLYDNCYSGMFSYCTHLTTPPILPATTLATGCYNSMLGNCTSLTTGPVLPATTLATNCYSSMFSGCTSLRTAPDLMATTLVSQCYQSMFYGCSSLNYIRCLALFTDEAAAYTRYWTDGVASVGVFVKNPTMEAWPLNSANGVPTGWTVTDTIPSEESESESESEHSSETPGPGPISDLGEYLTFNITSAGNIVTSVGTNTSYEYKKNDGSWMSVTSPISVTSGDVVQFRGNSVRYNCINFQSSTCGFTVRGNVMSIYDKTNFENATTLEVADCFSCLFKNCAGLTSAESLVLPATTLSNYCYSSMFEECSSLTTPPVLPAQTLTEGAYGSMFKGCTSLNYIKCLATDISARYCVDSWVRYVAATGTFVKADAMEDWTIDSIDGIPIGWTLIDMSDECDSDYGDSDYGDSDSDEPIITVSVPVISLANNTLTITCETTGATIYYKLGENGTYQTYTTPVALGADTTVYSYASLNGADSEVVSEEFIHNYSLDYVTLDVLTGGSILWKAIGSGATKTISYSKNGGAWTDITSTSSGTAITVSAGDSIRIKGSNTRYCEANKNNYSGFDGDTATYNVSGNIMSLVSGDNFVGVTTLPGSWTFTQFFKQSGAVSAENFILPATTMTESCYRAMFSKATSLVKAPKILPATTLGTYCYYYMFENCAITTAPELPAATLNNYSYGYMFTGCSSLNYIKCLATTKSASNCLQNWVNGVAPTGTFVKDANTSWSTGTSGIPTGWVVFDGEVIDSPVITFNGEDKITITCATAGTTIYYRLGQTGSYSVYSGTITISDDTVVEAYAEKNNQQSQTVSQSCTYVEHVYKYAGLNIAHGPLYYGSNGYEIKDSWNYESYGAYCGKVVGSYYFSFIEMGELFEKSGFTKNDGNIENTLDPLDGWRLPTLAEVESLIGSTREGSTVNGTPGVTCLRVEINNETFAGYDLWGILIFPDGETMTGETVSEIFDSISLSGLNNYISQGCIFLPSAGSAFNNNGTYLWTGYGTAKFLTRTEDDTDTDHVYSLSLTEYDIHTDNYNDKVNSYSTVWLVRTTTYGEETPFEGATKNLNTWTI